MCTVMHVTGSNPQSHNNVLPVFKGSKYVPQKTVLEIVVIIIICMLIVQYPMRFSGPPKRISTYVDCFFKKIRGIRFSI